MAQLGADKVAIAENASDPSSVIDDGIYLATLEGEVEVKASTNGSTWVWTFVIDPGQPFAGRKVWHRTWTSDASLWKLKDTFAAFGVPMSTNTDTLEGEKVRLKIIVKDHYSGELEEETGLLKQQHDVSKVLPATGPTGVDEHKKKLRAEARAAALEAIEAAGPASADSEDILF